jgi:hypothetical protein
VDVLVNPAVQYQTMKGWEAVAQAGQDQPGYAGWRDKVIDLAVNDLGLNRLRLEVKPGAENTRDYYAEMRAGSTDTWRCVRWLTVNDNNDPAVLNLAGFRFSQVDSVMVNLVQPMRQRMQARGEQLYVSFNYVAFIHQCATPPYFHDQPAEYAEFILAHFIHLRDTYQLVPDAVEIILEPDNIPEWSSGTLIGQAMVATSARLAAAGFHPEFIAPSVTNMAKAVPYFDDLVKVPGAAQLIDVLSYHRYGGVSTATLAQIAQRAASRGIRTGMLEHIASGVEDLYQDLTVGMNSEWQQFGLAFPLDADNGGLYYRIINGQPVESSRTSGLRQYFRYVRFGAVRIGATSSLGSVRPVAFRNTNGGMVVVLHIEGARTVRVGGLAAGTYGASISTGSATGTELGDRVAGADGIVSVTAPAGGVLTIYRK